jgi:hypothetical protein
MSITTELTVTSRRLRQITAVCAGALTLVACLSAHAAFVFSGSSTQGLPIAGNDFNTQLQGLGFNQMTTGAQLGVDMDGSVTFYYIAAESAYINSFNSGSTITEDNDSFNWDGWDSFSIDVAAGDILDFSFTSASASALTPVDNFSGTNLQGLGIMASTSTSDLVLAYNDNILGDSDYDDMLVRAEFRSVGIPEVPEIPGVPLPAAVWLFGSGLIGLIGMARRHKQ